LSATSVFPFLTFASSFLFQVYDELQLQFDWIKPATWLARSEGQKVSIVNIRVRQCSLSVSQTTLSPGWAHGGRAPAKIIRAPAKNNCSVHVKKSKKSKWRSCVVHGGWSRGLSHTHSYPDCHAPDRLVIALADHGFSQYTSITAYDYS